MSEYNIYSISSYNTISYDCKVESVGENSFVILEEETPNPPAFPINTYDIVRVTVSQNGINKQVYGVYENQTYDGTDYRVIVGFDSNVYGNLIEANTDIIVLEYYPLPTTPIVELKSYNLSPNIQVATYGKSFNAYNVRESYTITAPKERIDYNSSFRELYSIDEKVLVDACSNKCYKVSPTELSAIALNGRVTTALNFNVLIK